MRITRRDEISIVTVVVNRERDVVRVVGHFDLRVDRCWRTYEEQKLLRISKWLVHSIAPRPWLFWSGEPE